MNRLLRLTGLAALVLLISIAAHAQAIPSTYSSTFAEPRADVRADGKLVISFTATGDLAGTLTLTLSPEDAGYAGEWAFMVGRLEETGEAAGTIDTPDGAAGSGAPQIFIQRGALSGTVAGAVVTFDADGEVTHVVAPLAVDAGTLEFKDAHGTGQATFAGLSLVF